MALSVTQAIVLRTSFAITHRRKARNVRSVGTTYRPHLWRKHMKFVVLVTLTVVATLAAGAYFGYICNPNKAGITMGLGYALLFCLLAYIPAALSAFVGMVGGTRGMMIVGYLAYVGAIMILGRNQFTPTYEGLCGHGNQTITSDIRKTMIGAETFKGYEHKYSVSYTDMTCPSGKWVGRNVVSRQEI